MPNTPIVSRSVAWSLVAMLAAPAAAQCTTPWSAVHAQGPNSDVRAITRWDPDGAGPLPEVLVVGGVFSAVGTMPAPGLAVFAPATGTWSTLPGGVGGGAVFALTTMANGDLVVGGNFVSGGNHVVRWNGTTWSAFGGGVGNRVDALLALPNGELVAGGTFTSAGGGLALGVARWNGSAWAPMPGLAPVSPFGMTVSALAQLANGNIAAAGFFTVLGGGGHLAVWNGSTWTPMGTTTTPHQSLLPLANGHVLAGSLTGALEWDGSSLSPVPGMTGDVRAFLALPDGDVLVAGGFTAAAPRIARWNGSTLAAVGAGCDANIYALLRLANDDVLVGGAFSTAGGAPAPGLARLSTTCPATVSSLGGGCANSTGLNVLTAASLPWIGAKFRAHATGMPAAAVVLSVYGVTPLAIPFASVHPAGLPSCQVLMSDDLVSVLLPVGGALDTQLSLPKTVALVGATFRHYVVPVEVGPTSISAISNSNPLLCTIGAF